MSTWNYRLVKVTYNSNEETEVYYEIREAYYNKDGSIWAITENAQDVCGETPESIKTVLDQMKEALNNEIIDLETFVFAQADFDKSSNTDGAISQNI